jgi:hypothetical protein
MSAQVVWTAILTVIAVGSASGCAWLGLALGRLRAAIAESSGRIEALSLRVARLEAADRPASTPAAVKSPSAIASPSIPDRAPRKPRSSDRGGSSVRADAGLDSAVVAPTLIAVPNLAGVGGATEASAGSADLERLGSRFRAIWELADAGASAEAIARATGHPIGQVELILGLRRQLSGVPGIAPAGTRRP